MTKSCEPGKVAGRVRAPASKSAMQRAVACAALASGTSVLRSPSHCADSRAALSVASALGAEVRESPGRIEITGIGFPGPSHFGVQARTLDCGESGLCMRMFTPIAALFPGRTELRASGSLRRRPLGPIEGPLAELGAETSTLAGLPPVTVRGPLHGGTARVDASLSSQFLTGLLVALPLAPDDSELVVSNIVSRGYVGLTLHTMRTFGVEAAVNADLSRFFVRGRQSYAAADFEVEGDWSGAAFLLAAGAIAAGGSRESEGASCADVGGVVVEGLRLDSEQPDRAILDVLQAAGAFVEVRAADGEARAGACSVEVRGGRLRAFDFDAADCPDLFPPLAALAACCPGRTTILGAGRLKAKESDRAAALAEELGALGARIRVEGDRMIIEGGRLGAGSVDARGDHRIAMAAAVAALAADGPVDVIGAECVAKSWPSFFEDLAALRF